MKSDRNAPCLAPPPVWPLPKEMGETGKGFPLEEGAAIFLPSHPSADDELLARILSADLIDRHGLAVLKRRGETPSGPRIVMGAASNPLVREECGRRGIPLEDVPAKAEGYLLDAGPDGILVAGRDEAGALFGLQTLRRLLVRQGGRLSVPGVRLRDWPRMPFRGLRFYLPGRENFPFFKRFVRDFASLNKFNSIVLETNAAMRLERHPELNAGWFELARCLNYTRRSRPEGPHRYFTDSTHHDTGDFAVVEKDEVADLVRFCRSHHIEVIPEIPALTHAYYLLTRHRELAEIQEAEWPDTWCPLKPEAYDVYFAVLDEYIEVMHPKVVHIGHDEWRMPLGMCPDCGDADRRDQFVEDVRKIHAYLKSKGVRTAMWGDHMLESVRGAVKRDGESPSGWKYSKPAAIRPEQAANDIPRDILVFNWFWNSAKWGEEGEKNDARLSEWGFEQVYGNFTPDMAAMNYGQRSQRKGVLGGAASAWMATTEFNFCKDEMYPFLGVANLVWSDEWPEPTALTRIVQSLMPETRRNLRAAPMPSEDGEAAAPLGPLAGAAPLPGIEPSTLAEGEIACGPWRFALPQGGQGFAVSACGAEAFADLPRQSQAIPVGKDFSSVAFLHACALPAKNSKAHFSIFNFADSADLLGWYEAVYEDGYVETIPVRYGVNVLEWTWGRAAAPGTVCWQADPADCAAPGQEPATFFAFEWANPRFGKTIREIRLKGTERFADCHGNPAEPNAIFLLALALADRRSGPVSEYQKEDF